MKNIKVLTRQRETILGIIKELYEDTITTDKTAFRIKGDCEAVIIFTSDKSIFKSFNLELCEKATDFIKQIELFKDALETIQRFTK